MDPSKASTNPIFGGSASNSGSMSQTEKIEYRKGTKMTNVTRVPPAPAVLLTAHPF